MGQKYNLIPKKLELSKGETQNYFIDENPKANFAQYRKRENKICVNKTFERLPKNEKIAILYHERGHSNFYLFGFFHELSQFYFSFSWIFMVFSALLFLTNQITNDLIFNIPNIIWVIFFLVGIFLFVGFMALNYLLESIADIYSVIKTDNLTLSKCLKDLYNQKGNKQSWWTKYILHPSPSMREKIMARILKW